MLAVRGRLDLLTGQMAVAQRELAESADLAAEADPLLAVELLDQAVSRPWRPGCTTRQARPPTARPIWPNNPRNRPVLAAWPTVAGLARGDAEDGMALIRRAVSPLEADPAWPPGRTAARSGFRLVRCRTSRSCLALLQPGGGAGPRRRRGRPPAPGAGLAPGWMGRAAGGYRRWPRKPGARPGSGDRSGLPGLQRLSHRGRGRGGPGPRRGLPPARAGRGTAGPRSGPPQARAAGPPQPGAARPRPGQAGGGDHSLRRAASADRADWGIAHPYYSALPT